jgi:hypothetical protein
MMLKASGISPSGWFGDAARHIAWMHVHSRQRRALAA